MKLIEKLKNLATPMKWAQGFMINKFGKRMAQFGTAAVVSLLTSDKLAAMLAQWGVTYKMNIDRQALADVLTVAIVAALGGIFNTAKHGPLKTVNDDPNAPPAPETPKTTK